MEEHLLASVHSTVFKESETLEGKFVKIEGYDFNQGINYSQLLKSMVSTGFQATNLGEAIAVVNKMVSCFTKDCILGLFFIRSTHFLEFFSLFGKFVGLKLDWSLADENPTEDCSEEERSLTCRESVRCKVFLGFTSNLISSGVRETVRFLVEHHMVRGKY